MCTVKEALLVDENREPRVQPQGYPRCQIGAYAAGGTPAFCVEPGKTDVDGLLLCEGHALEASLEGQVACWGEVLFHVDLWSREADCRERPDVVRLLDVQREEATSAMQSARVDLDVVRRESPRETRRSTEVLRGDPLPPSDARPPSRGSRRHRHRWSGA